MRKLVLGAMALCVALTAATFTGPAFARTSGGNASAATPPKTSGFESLGPVELNVWSYDNQKPGLQDVIEQMTANFEKKYPNVKINLKFMDFNSLVNTVNRALASNNGPDITEGNQGYQTDALQVKAKLILPLDKYVKAYELGQVVGPLDLADLPVDARRQDLRQGPEVGRRTDRPERRALREHEEAGRRGHQALLADELRRLRQGAHDAARQAAEERARVPVRQQGGVRHDPLPRRHPGRLRQRRSRSATGSTTCRARPSRPRRTRRRCRRWPTGRRPASSTPTTTPSAMTTPRSSSPRARASSSTRATGRPPSSRPASARTSRSSTCRPARAASTSASARPPGRGTSRPRRSTRTSPRPG